MDSATAVINKYFFRILFLYLICWYQSCYLIDRRPASGNTYYSLTKNCVLRAIISVYQLTRRDGQVRKRDRRSGHLSSSILRYQDKFKEFLERFLSFGQTETAQCYLCTRNRPLRPIRCTHAATNRQFRGSSAVCVQESCTTEDSLVHIQETARMAMEPEGQHAKLTLK